LHLEDSDGWKVGEKEEAAFQTIAFASGVRATFSPYRCGKGDGQGLTRFSGQVAQRWGQAHAGLVRDGILELVKGVQRMPC
jgi:hypothetical protein